MKKSEAEITNEIGQDDDDFDDNSRGTVGAVAVDQFGNLAAATSTGGLTNQMVGRVGDTPIIGAGNYADSYAGKLNKNE